MPNQTVETPQRKAAQSAGQKRSRGRGWRLPSLYFDWLQKDNPTGTVDRLPELHDSYETNIPGMYCVGDLRGIPLIKLAAESGHELLGHLEADERFQQQRKTRDEDRYDLVIVGAGPAGLSAALRAQKLGYRFVVLETARAFNTIKGFPAGKPIYVTPADPPMESELRFEDGTKETLLEQLNATISDHDLPIRVDETVKRVEADKRGFTVHASSGEFKSLRVIVAIGRAGNPRRLKVPGEEKAKVYSRLIDPTHHNDEDVLVVGGGDSALEAAVALAKSGNRVTLSYRREQLSRPKERNVQKLEEQVEEGRITKLLSSTVKRIDDESVTLDVKGEERQLPNDTVYTLIGTEIPIAFFRRSGIQLEGDREPAGRVKIAASLLFASTLYFGKKAPTTEVSGLGDFLRLPTAFMEMAWPQAVAALIAWLSFMGMLGTGLYLAVHFGRRAPSFFGGLWRGFKHSYFIAAFLLFGAIYLTHNLAGNSLLGLAPGFWYTMMYSATIVVFGWRRIHVRPTGYIKRQTLALMAFQLVPLFLLPLIVLPWLGEHGFLGDWVMHNVFPDGSYWRAYGFILAWPLFIHTLAIGQPTTFWLILGLLQTFLIIPWLNLRWGKGAYCGWICSCGALAETLGDEYRTKAPHGPTAKQTDNAGQVVLWFAGGMTLLMLGRSLLGTPEIASGVKQVYEIGVDIILAGVIGVGMYFFLSGRVWCRFFCPLAALMHIYTRFSVYRIMANKHRCISCGICTKVCHMGIDVMGYANRGVPMNDVQCVRCSACVVNCPLQVLTFNEVSHVDLDNVAYHNEHIPLKRGWASGLPKRDIDALVAEEQQKQAQEESHTEHG